MTIIQCLSYTQALYQSSVEDGVISADRLGHSSTTHKLACIGGSLFHFHASMNGIDDSWEWFHYQEVLYLSPNKTCISMLKTRFFNNAIDGLDAALRDHVVKRE